jgi:hypothetical protein
MVEVVDFLCLRKLGPGSWNKQDEPAPVADNWPGQFSQRAERNFVVENGRTGIRRFVWEKVLARDDFHTGYFREKPNGKFLLFEGFGEVKRNDARLPLLQRYRKAGIGWNAVPTLRLRDEKVGGFLCQHDQYITNRVKLFHSRKAEYK